MDSDAPDPIRETVAAAASALPFEALFMALPVAASVSRLSDGCLLAVNEAWEQLTGLRRDQALGRTTVELGHWVDPVEREGFIGQLPGVPVSAPVRLHLKGGVPHLVRLHARIVRTGGEDLLLVQINEAEREVQDQAARQHASEALRQVNAALRQRLALHDVIEKTALVGHWTCASDAPDVTWSDGLFAITGLAARERLGREEARAGIHPDDLEAWLRARERLDGEELVFRWQRSDGQLRWLRSRMGRALVDGNIPTDFGVVQDITAEPEASARLRQQLRLLQHIAERVPGLIYQARRTEDHRSTITYVNDAARKMLEVEPAELMRDGRVLFERVHPDDRARLRESQARSASALTPWRETYRVLLPVGGERWYAVEAVPQLEPDGAVVWHGFTSDVTDSRLQAQRSERLNRMLAAITQAQANYIEADDKRAAFEGLLGAFLSATGSEYGFLGEVQYDAQGRPSLHTHALSDIAWDEPSRQRFAAHRESGMVFDNLDTLFGHALRTGQPVLANDSPHDPRAGGMPAGHPGMRAFLGIPLAVGDRLVAMVGLANQPGGYHEEDIAFLQPLLGALRQLVLAWRAHGERLRTQLELQATSALLADKSHALQVTLDSISQGLLKLDPDGRVRVYNRRFLELLDLPDGLMGAQPLHDEVIRFQRERGDFGPDLDWVDAAARSYLRGEQGLCAPARYFRHTREGRTLEICSFALAEGGLVRTYSDVTPFIQAQEEIRALNASLEQRVGQRTAELERSMRDMEAISYSIAHDLRAPLRSVNGFAQVIAEEELARLSPNGQAMFERVARASRNMGQMISDMLELLRVVQVGLRPAPVDMAVLAHSVADALGSPLPQARIEVQPMPRALGDATLLRQVLSNLLDNALKYARAQVPPHVVVGHDAGAGAYFVRDNGVGFAMEQSARLFGLFQRLHADSAIPGMGVGLAIVSRIVERHGGRIWAESAPGQGATFWFSLPLA